MQYYAKFINRSPSGQTANNLPAYCSLGQFSVLINVVVPIYPTTVTASRSNDYNLHLLIQKSLSHHSYAATVPGISVVSFDILYWSAGQQQGIYYRTDDGFNLKIVS